MKLKVHPAVNHMIAIRENIPAKTGKSLEEWSAIVTKAGLSVSKDIIAFLKAEYRLGRPTCMVIASDVLGAHEDFDADAYLEKAPTVVDAQFTGKKEHLREFADKLYAIIEEQGDDVGASPCKTYVPFYRNHVFAQVKAATQKRIDLGLALKDYDGELPARLIDTGGLAKGDRITHRIEVSSADDVDDDLISWIKSAYELDA